MNFHAQFSYASIKPVTSRDWLIVAGPAFFAAQVARATKIPLERIRSRSRRPRDVRARKLAIQAVHKGVHDISLAAIGEYFGVDRTTVAQHLGLRKLKKRAGE